MFHHALLQRICDQATNHERPQKGHVLNEFHLVNVNLMFSWQAPHQSHGTFPTSCPSPTHLPGFSDLRPRLPTTTTTSYRSRCFGKVDSQASRARAKALVLHFLYVDVGTESMYLLVCCSVVLEGCHAIPLCIGSIKSPLM